MRCILGCAVALVLAAWLLCQPVLAQESTGPDAFASLLLLENHYGPGPDDGDLLDLWLSHINETNPDLLSEPACYAPLAWAWPEFSASTSYTAEDEYGEWDVSCDLYGVMNLDQLVTIDGVDYPYIASLTADYSIDWRGKDGSSFSTAWSYTLEDIPPVAQPASDVFTQGLPNGLPADRLTYSLHAKGKPAVAKHMTDFYYSTSTSNPDFPDSDYASESDGEAVRTLDFDMIMYYFADTGE
jgi:hypothetical protein